MLPSLLILSISLQLAWTCLPMKPAEDMHCPSVPLAAAVDMYAVDGLKKSIVNGAEVYSCEPKALLLEVDGTTVKEIDGGKISCMPNSGIFVDDKMMAVNQKKYNCGKKADNCDNCKGLVKTVFDRGTSDEGATVPANPVCVTTCQDGFDIYVNGVKHDKVICSMATDKITVDSASGEVLSAGNKFTCVGCECAPGEMNDGKAGLCPPDKLCTMPTGGTACKATCPPDTQALYKDKNTGDLKKSASIQCPKGQMDWFADYEKDAGVTCQYEDGKGYSSQPPVDAVEKCNMLEVQDCPSPNGCKPDELIYVGDGEGGYSVTCKEGSLITNEAPAPEGGDLTQYCRVGNPWQITKANCLIDDTQVQACTTGVPTGIFNVKCAFGACSITCKIPAQKFMYDLNPGAAGETSPYLLCAGGELTDPTRNGIVAMTSVKCVP